MDFGPTEDQQALMADIRSFAEQKLGQNLVERDRRGAVEASDWRDDWQCCADFGVLGMNVPVQYGGQGHGVLTTILALEALGQGCADNGLTLGLNGQMWAVQEPILASGFEEQKRRYLPGLCDGSLIGAHAMTEPETGSDTFSLKSRAERDGDTYILNGQKTYIGLAPACDIALVFASTNPDAGQWGISAFIVDAHTPGFTRHSAQQKMGLRTAPMGEITLENRRVPADAMLGNPGAGVSIFGNSMEWERSFIFASHIGSMARQLDQCIDFARERRQFGQPIGSFQSVSNRIADMQLRLESARLLLYRAAWRKDRGEACAMDAALVKLHLSEAFVASSLDAVRIHGGRGYLTEHQIERDLRDATGGVIYSGTSDIQRQMIARLLGLPG